MIIFCGINSISTTNREVSERGTILYVGGSGPGNYSSIQSALDVAFWGFTIFVYSGIYHENVIVDETVSLIGENPENTIIDGGGNGNVVTIYEDGVELNGFKIKNGTFVGIYLYDCDNCLVHNNIIDAKFPDYGTEGMSIYLCVNNVIRNNIFINNYQDLIIASSSSNLIYHNNFFNNTNKVYDFGSNNWDNGYPIGGNYWNNYTGIDDYHGHNQDIIGSDGIGDNSFNISGGNNKDDFPLMEPWGEVYPSGFITNTKSKWNFISLPFNQSLSVDDVLIDNLGDVYNWSEATDPVNGPIVDDNIYSWDRNLDMYIPVINLEPGFGYWIYSYVECDIWTLNITTISDGFITNINQTWNVIGVPNNEPVNLTDLIVNYLGIDYTWLEATDPVNGPIVDPNVYGWDRTNGMYVPVGDTLDPGYAYWMYAYEDCTLKLIIDIPQRAWCLLRSVPI